MALSVSKIFLRVASFSEKKSGEIPLGKGEKEKDSKGGHKNKKSFVSVPIK